jgi:hypothetical protein
VRSDAESTITHAARRELGDNAISREQMTIDLNTLDYKEFELVVGALLVRSGYHITAQAKRGQRGPDFEVAAPSGERIIVEVKHFRQPIPSAMVAQLAGDIARYRLQSPDTKGLIVISGTLSAAAAHRIAVHPELEVWTGDEVVRRLSAHPDILAATRASVGAFQALSALSMLTASLPPPKPASAQYTKRLAAIAAGRGDWREFEIWCTEILTDIFKPDLGPPDRQIRTDDGLDIMDAIFPIRAGAPPWSQVRAEFATRFVVSEYKNYVEPIGQKQVESIAQYLWANAKRQFGILVSRTAPADSALAQRRRAWLDQSKMIAFLSDRELVEMLEMREEGDDPFEVIDAQLEEFLRTLTP